MEVSVTPAEQAGKRPVNTGPDEAGRRAAVLRARLRAITTSRRTRLCSVTKCKREMGVWVEGNGDARKARPVGVMTCNSVWICPCCARRSLAKRHDQLKEAIREGLERHPKHVWKMLSITLRHHDKTPLMWLRKGMMRAWRRTRQHGEVARIMKRRVCASVRKVEITLGSNGWHPHIHLGILTTAWEEHERATLFRVWAESCAQELGDSNVPDVAHGIRWSKRELRRGDGGTKLEAYLTDIGLEFATVSTKTAKRESSNTSWQVAERAASGEVEAIKLWREYEAATKGARCLELDDRAAGFVAGARTSSVYKADDEISLMGWGALHVAMLEGSKQLEQAMRTAPTVDHVAVYVELHPEMMRHVRDYEQIDPRATSLWLEAAQAPGPLTVEAVSDRIDACIRWMVAKVRASPERGRMVG